MFNVKFSGALTLTYNAASLILPSLANIATAANDCATVLALGGGNFQVIGYQTASGKAIVSPTLASLGAIFQKTYTSSASNIAAGSLFTFAHGLGVQPKVVKYFLQCTTAAAGWSVGQVMEISSKVDNDAGSVLGFMSWSDATNVYVAWTTTNSLCLVSPAGGSTYAVTLSGNFSMFVTAYA